LYGTMNRRQSLTVAAGSVALLGVVLFPPWLAVTNWADGHVDRDPAGHHFLFVSPDSTAMTPELTDIIDAKRRAGAHLYSGPDFYIVDTMRLIVPFSVILAVTSGAVVLLGKKGSPLARSQTNA